MSAVPQHYEVLDLIVQQAGDISVLPQVVYKVIELTGKQDVSAKEVEEVISVDPGYSTRVLQVVNSAYFCLPKQVGSIRDAVMFIGFTQIRQMAMTIGAFDLFMGKTDKVSMRKREWWRHSLDAAAVAKHLAHDWSDINPDEAYSAALLHDFGKTMLERYGGRPYDEVEALISQGCAVTEAERRVYGVNHCEAGMAVARGWRFPTILVESIGYHHVPGPDLDYPQLCAIVAVASRFAHLHTDQGDKEPLDVVPEWAGLVLALDRDKAAALYAGCAEQIERLKSLSGVL